MSETSRDKLWDFNWRTLSGEAVRADPDLVETCCELYSEHYGQWGPLHRNAGQPVVLAGDRFLGLFGDKGSLLACAFDGKKLIGYCAAVFTDTTITPSRIAWVSQLVVHEDFRHQRVATRLLFSVWQFSDCAAWGLVTSNPLAVRALESATRREASAELIVSEGDRVLQILGDRVPYLPQRLKRAKSGEILPTVFTEFLVSHENVDELLRLARAHGREWTLGDLIDGHEWFACTFSVQKPAVISDERLEEILVGADRTWIDAYGRMSLDSDHVWRKYAPAEVEYIASVVGLSEGDLLLDVGCGDGRHARLFAERGIRVHAVDVVQSLVEKAKANTQGLPVIAETVDVRERVPEGIHDAAILLYDVLGSSPGRDDGFRLLRNTVQSLKKGAPVVISVMNATPTLEALDPSHQPGDRDEFLEALESLSATGTMESTGNVFDPDHILYFNEVFYRKEQFIGDGDHLPSEYVIRDSRYSVESVSQIVARAGVEIDVVKPVLLGAWDSSEPISEHDVRAKEILVFGHVA